ncbi:hypothetical protein L7F22_068744 [Adiantum nelumboides]|nr:hypothetical protein [Adiantum nelumboides]
MLVHTVSWLCAFTGFRLNSLLFAASEAGLVDDFGACTYKHAEDLPYKTIPASILGSVKAGMAGSKQNYPDSSAARDAGDDGSSSDTNDVSFSQSNSLHVSGKEKELADMDFCQVDADPTQNLLYPMDSQDIDLAGDLAAATNALKNEKKRIAPGESDFPKATDTRCKNGRRMDTMDTFQAINTDNSLESSNTGSEAQEPSTSLRAWLCNSSRVMDRIESLHIFKQIAEFVELAHSQGVVLRNVRPSSFILSPMSRISIIESASSRSSSSSSAESTGRGAAVNVADVELHKVTQSVKNTAAQSMGFEMWRASGSSVPMDEQRGSQNVGDKSEESTSEGLQIGKGKHVADEDEGGRSYTSSSSDHADNRLNIETFPLKEILLMESMWYKSPEELGGGTPEFSSDLYSLGVLLVELFYSSGSQGEWSRAMSDLRHRLLPPSFLLGFPKEAAFCLLLLHPNADCRPKAREVLHADIFSEIEDKLAEREAIMHLDERVSEAETTLDFLLQMQQRKHVISQKLVQEFNSLEADIGEVKRWQALLMKNRWNEDFRKKSIKLAESFTSGAGGLKLLSDHLVGNEDVVGSNNSRNGLSGRRQELVVTKSAQLLRSFTQLREAYLSVINTKSGIGLMSGMSKRSKQRSEHLEKMGLVKLLDEMSGSQAERQSGWRLGCFFDDFCLFMKHSKFDVRATLQYGDILNTKNMVCSLNFDCDDEYFATAGVSRRIKIFDCNALLEGSSEVHYPVIEMSSRRKLSCVCWNKFRKNLLSSSDLEGFIQLWDVTTGQTSMELKEHSKCAWSVDFSHFDSSRLASGSDDCFVKLWSTNQTSHFVYGCNIAL